MKSMYMYLQESSLIIQIKGLFQFEGTFVWLK